MQDHENPKTVIGEDVEIVGSVKSASHVQIDGKLNGDVTCAGNAIIGPTAVVKGNIGVDSVVVSGQVSGNITAKDRIELKASARLNGDIRSRRLTVEDGVTFVGKSEVNPSGSEPARGSPGQEPKSSPQKAQADEEPVLDDNQPKARAGGIFSKRP